jgi:recombination protein RecT
LTQSTELAKINGRDDAQPGLLAKYLKQQITSIAGSSASNIDPNKLCRIVVRAVQMNEQLQKCSMISIFRASLISAELGLEIGGGTGQSYLVPFGKQCQFVPGYKGLVTLAYRSGMIEDVAARVVYKDDEFSIDLAASPPFAHKPCLTGNRTESEIVCFYCVVRVRGSAYPHFDWMSKSEVDAIRNASAGRGQAPWKEHYAEQGKKTVAKRTLKMIPLSPETAKAIAYDNGTETGDFREVVFDFEEDNPDLIPAIEARVDRSGKDNVERAATDAAVRRAKAVSTEGAHTVGPDDLEMSAAESKAHLIPAPIPLLKEITRLCQEKKQGEQSTCRELFHKEAVNLTTGEAQAVIAYLEGLL